MLRNDSSMVIEALAASEWRRRRTDDWAVYNALKLYHKQRWQALARRAWSVLSGRSCELYDLAGLCPSLATPGYERMGVQPVAIKKIRGSECKALDFDADFRPLTNHYRMRWLRVAAARLAREPLPPVTLIQVGEVFFVRDGHHRLSVARALGQRHIDARVLVWHARGPLPWDGVAYPTPLLDRPLAPA
jgi:hypothetical protein